MSQISRPTNRISHGGPIRLRQMLHILVVCVSIVSITAIGLFLVHQREQALADARTRASDAARLLEEHVIRTFRASDFIIGRVAELGRSAPMAELAHDERAWRELMALVQGLPEPGTLWLVDTDGVVRLGTVKFPATPHNLTDRHYFAAHKEARLHFVVGPLVQVRDRTAQAFHLSRRVEDAQGRFLGVAAAGLDAQTFTNFYQTMTLGPNASLTIVDLQGRIILRQPGPERFAGASVAGGPLMTALSRGEPKGVLTAVSPLDNVERLVAYRLIAEFGVVVAATVALDDALADWRQSVWVAAGSAGLLALLLGVLVSFTFASLAREEELMHGLEEAVREGTEEARRQAEEARRANESKTRFLAAASHDLRQPLQAAGMFVEALSARMAESPHLGLVDKLRQSIDATQALLTTLLDVSTLEAGKIEPQVTTFTLMPLLANLYDQMEHEATAKSLRLKVVPTGARVVSDPVLLERMLRNLVVNAVRYTDRGGVVLGCRRRGNRLAICVVDSGPGIPAEQRQAIFDDFTRLDGKGSGASRGLGLGLGVVRRMATLLNHEIELRSTENRGSCFTVLVPLAPARPFPRGNNPLT